MAWNERFCFFMGHACGVDEMPEDLSLAYKPKQVDEDAAFTEARENRAGFNDGVEDDQQ